jgi:murein DD-endopeptidase MepM/ murein hydrolase activator NlpD
LNVLALALAASAFFIALRIWDFAEERASASRERGGERPPADVRPPRPPARRAGPPAPIPTGGSASDMTRELRERRLLVPVAGVRPSDLVASFGDPRGERRHEALDIPAARNTPVLAVDGGRVARLFYSKAGGITVYHYDSAERFVYYYAHLERYANGLTEGDPVRRGQVIGYVGTSGNAPDTVPHLHFAILRLTTPGRWWQGAPVDPYLVFASG